jgi:16S rRNA (cytosine967-C5)-methyltransferase
MNINQKHRPQTRFQAKDPARETALAILNQVDGGRHTLDQILEDLPSDLSRKDLSLLHALVFGVLRWRGRLDWVIGRFSKIPLQKVHPAVMNALRMGLFQILFMDRVPASAAVNTSVDLIKLSTPKASGFVNGTLRNALRNLDTLSFPDPSKDASALAVVKSFPDWLIQRWLKRLGPEETGRLCDAFNAIPPITIRANTLKTTREGLLESLRLHGSEIRLSVFSPYGLLFSRPDASIPNLDAFKKGWFQVQDEAAQLAVCLLSPQPGETVLDACAGLGVKTGQIAQMMENQGRILALDLHEHKLSRLEKEMERLGVSIVKTRAHTLDTPLTPDETGVFDRIIVDAPCSGLGVIRRNPDIKWAVSKKDLGRYQDRQVRFLTHLAPLVRPSGLMVYSVCSAEPEETREVIRLFREKHPEFTIKGPDTLPEKIQSLITSEGCLVTFPHLHDMDGFFSVALSKTSDGSSQSQ